jgi:hypothetical protein
MAKAAFNAQFLGDGITWIGSDYERMTAAQRPLLWATRPSVQDTSPNFLWRIRVVVWAKRSDAVALAIALETTARSIGGSTGDLKIYADDNTTLLRTYPSCRFDAMIRKEGPRESRGDFEDAISFVFVTNQDPE